MNARGLCLLAALSVAGCKTDPTQLVVVVDTDYVVPTELGAVRVTIDDANGGQEAIQEFDLVAADQPTSTNGVHMPFSFGLVPLNGDASRLITIQVDGLKHPGDTSPLVTRSAFTGFVKHEMKRLDMFLAKSCAGKICPSGQTCVDGACQVSNLPPDQLPGVVAGMELPDARATDAASPPSDGPVTIDAEDTGSRDGMSPDGSPDGMSIDAQQDAGDAGHVLDAGDSGPIDSGSMCPATCPASCTPGDCCSPSCPNGVCPACMQNCTCDLSCIGGANSCGATCNSGSTCTLHVSGPDQGTVTCQDGANCNLQCGDTDTCSLTCMATAQCLIQCQSPNCHLNCTGTSSTTCPGGVHVCNRACP
jgi:hypothetical protein